MYKILKYSNKFNKKQKIEYIAKFCHYKKKLYGGEISKQNLNKIKELQRNINSKCKLINHLEYTPINDMYELNYAVDIDKIIDPLIFINVNNFKKSLKIFLEKNINDFIKEKFDKINMFKIKIPNNYLFLILIDQTIVYNTVIDNIKLLETNKQISSEMSETIICNIKKFFVDFDNFIIHHLIKYDENQKTLIVLLLNEINKYLSQPHIILHIKERGRKSNNTGMEAEEHIFKLLEKDKYKDIMHTNIKFKKEISQCKSEFDVILGQFENNKFDIDMIYDVKTSADLLYSDIELFNNGILHLLNKQKNPILVNNAVSYTSSNEQKNVKKGYIYIRPFSNSSSERLIKNNIILGYIDELKKNMNINIDKLFNIFTNIKVNKDIITLNIDAMNSYNPYFNEFIHCKFEQINYKLNNKLFYTKEYIVYECM